MSFAADSRTATENRIISQSFSPLVVLWMDYHLGLERAPSSCQNSTQGFEEAN